MIDYLILGGFSPSVVTDPATGDPLPAPPCWTDEAGRAVLPVKVWRATDESGPVYLPGDWYLVRTEALDPALQAMPGYRWAWSDDDDGFVDVKTDDDLELSGWWA